MQRWILEADIYRLKRALSDASKDQRDKIVIHLRKAQAALNRFEPVSEGHDARSTAAGSSND